VVYAQLSRFSYRYQSYDGDGTQVYVSKTASTSRYQLSHCDKKTLQLDFVVQMS
jgi:hypothetical protein